MKTIKDIETAIGMLKNAAIEHTIATEKGDYKTANKNYTIIVYSVSFLKERNEILKLSDLLNHTINRCSFMGCCLFIAYNAKRIY
jgi:hypothetical protein